MRQLNNTYHYEVLDEDPIQIHNGQVLHTLQQAANLNIIDDKLMKILYN